jgi:hypothetical protein
MNTDRRAECIEAIKASGITGLDEYGLATSIQLAEEIEGWHAHSRAVLPLLYAEWNRRSRSRIMTETQAAEAVKKMEAVQS